MAMTNANGNGNAAPITAVYLGVVWTKPLAMGGDGRSGEGEGRGEAAVL